ncbi:transcription activator MSS11-like [Dendroctonus ponderosae]|uniref:transcription activator MSS11-like n=1 Tax=Dendroctonus ponderosae TaxID=77166 RepID=UPI002034F97B|nr:transcription activator MSS11-like [Dendroctonus ponderosae]KAH1010168.1 hypothetical protein HUJ05_004506 [Dendroctonus ponderosae]
MSVIFHTCRRTMKVPILILLVCAGIQCELPPPYLRQDFRPSPQQYQPIKTIDVKIPSRLTIEQLIKLTEQLQNSQERVVNRPQKIQVSFEQNSYLPPSRPAQQTVNFQPQDSYLPPSKTPGQQSSYLPPARQPEQIYRPPAQFRPPSQPQNGQSFRPQNNQNIELAFAPQRPQHQFQTQQPNFERPQNQFQSQQPNLERPQNQFQTQRPNFERPENQFQSQQPNLERPQNQFQTQRPNFERPQNQFQTQRPQNQYTPSQGFRPEGTNQNQFSPAQTGFRPSNQYGAPQNSPEKLQNSQQSLPQATYGVPNRETSGSVNNQQKPPATNYGVPDVRPLETLDEQRTDEEVLRQKVLDALKKQQLPYKPASGFRPDSVNQQYLPSEGEGSVGQSQTPFSGNRPQNRPAAENPGQANKPATDIGQGYLPPKGVAEGGFNSRPSTARPPVTESSPESVDGLSQPDQEPKPQQPTDNPLNQEGAEAGPNISIANAVAGGGNFFYLQQPDGRLQKVVLEKTREPNSKPEEYVANYYFQNIQALPNVVYTPLVTLDYTQQ